MSLEFPELPTPEIIDTSTYEEIFEAKIERFKSRYPAYTNLVEGDPIYMLLQDVSYDELNLRKRINNAYRQTNILYATGANLDNLVANVNLVRQVKQEAVYDSNGILETPEIVETDEQLRRRYLLAWHALGLGTFGWYKYHALNADVNVKDALPERTGDGEVTVWIQSEESGGGIPTASLLTKVRTYMAESNRAAVAGSLTIAGVTKKAYTITAEISVLAELDPAEVVKELTEKVTDWAVYQEVIGDDIPLSAFYAALSVAGVSSVTLTSPTATVTTTETQVAVADTITITAA